MFRTAVVGSAAVALVAGALATWTVGPEPPARPEYSSGDRALADRARSALGDAPGVSQAAVARIDGDRVTFAGLAQDGTVDQATPFETGSLGKPLTGMLLADLVDQGEVTLTQQAQGVVPGTGTTSLRDLATHHSGLPRLTRSQTLKGGIAALRGKNPYAAYTPETVLDDARDLQAPGGKEYRYSNLGASVLGQLLAATEGVAYPDLLEERILDPLGMSATVESKDVPEGGAAPVAANGRAQEPWHGTGFAPAGLGWWSTTGDLAKLLQGLMAGTAPGAAATRPLADTGSPDRRVGLGWLTERGDLTAGRTVVWHNGGTGGTRTFAGYDAQARRGVVLLATTSSDAVDRAGFRLLAH